MDSMDSNQVWTLIDLPKVVKLVGCKWVYKHKLGAEGEINAFKARLVAKEYTQRPRVNFELTYSPVAMAKSIWILLAIAACPSMASNNIPKARTHVLMRLDIACALRVTSRYQACVKKAHWSTVKTILKYLKRIRSMFLIYGGRKLIVEGYSDTSFQSNDDDVKSQSDFVFKVNSGVVVWKSSQQATTTDSTT
ncbi:UNVERIFIED_CONTAM: hypothetical protein Sangu_2932400 [Sesamum angustifolium]|uniref:Reverse transcriptase Ty1/copia-type domain-containing protein n=1 Tax=Sesamum angustifolium TaxID=2727405 RepID=A0AAW2IKE5_9LAMI